MRPQLDELVDTLLRLGRVLAARLRVAAAAMGRALWRGAEAAEAWLGRMVETARPTLRWEVARPWLAAAATGFAAALAEGWRWLRPPLVFALQVVAALVVLFEEWGWRPLAAFLASLARFAPWARLERAIAGLPPYGALAALALPTSILFPLKFVAIYLLAQGQALAATALFIAAKIASTALIARIFLLTKPVLMQIGWFAAAHDLIVPWKDRMFAMIRASWPWRYGRMVKTRVRLEAQRLWARVKPRVAESLARARARVRLAWERVKPRLAAEAERLRSTARRLWQRVSQA